MVEQVKLSDKEREGVLMLIEVEGLVSLMENDPREIWPHRLERIEEYLEKTISLGTKYDFKREILAIRYHQLKDAVQH